MEKARYWMWKSHFDASWEEEAFARDASQPYGAFIWPPRSYSCSFCRREFRTAQALGGHMNVHRRDRARLKLQLTSTTPPDHDKSMATNHEDSDEYQIPTAPPKVSVASIDQKQNRAEQPPQPLVSYYVDDQDQHDHEGNFSYFPQSWSNSVPIRVFSISDCERGKKNPTKRRRSEVHDEGNSNKYDPSSMSLNLVMGSDHKEQTVGCKRIRSEGAPLPFFLKGSSTTTLVLESTAEDLDLELRLGDPTKVK